MKRRTIAVTAGLILAVLVLGTAATLYWASRSEAILRWAVAQAAQRLPGELRVEGISGSLTEPVTLRHLHYAQDGIAVDARDAALDWAPWDLIARKRVHIFELRMRELTVVAGDGKAGGTPVVPHDLSLPIALEIDRLLIAKIDVRKNAASVFSTTDVRFGYAGDARGHKLTLESITTPWGSAAATARLAAQPPFALSGSAQFRGEVAPAWPASAHIDFHGTLSALDVILQLELRGTPITASARLAPLAQTPVSSLTTKVTGVDLKKFIPSAPHTRIDAVYEAKGVSATQLEGDLTLNNSLAGTVDHDRVPLTSLQGHLSASPDGLQLTHGSLDLASAGKAAIEANVTPDLAAVTLTTARVDLRGIHSALRTTHLAGSVTASFGRNGQQYRGTLSQDAMQLAFLARQERDVLVIESARAQAGAARITASGTLNLAIPNAFSARAELSRFDPAAFGDFPSASVNGSFDVSGTLQPDWRVALAYRLARSTFRGQPLSGSGKLHVAAHTVSDVDADIALGSNHLHLAGAFGQERDVMRVKLDAPALRALGTQWSGSVRAEGLVSGTFARPGFELDLSARDLALPGDYRAAALQLRGRLQPDPPAQFDVSGHAQGLHVHGQAARSAELRGTGNISQHRLEARIVRDGADAQAIAEGSFDPATRSWSGRLMQLENRGEYPLRLTAPTTLKLAAEQIDVGSARIELVGGQVAIGELRYAHDEITGNGELTGLSLAKILEWSKVSTPVKTTMLIGGQWKISARQHVDGHIELHRESGDASIVVDEEQLALQIAQLAARVDVVSDAVSAELQLEAKGLGQVTARAQTRLSQRDGRWGVSGRSPLSLVAQADVVTIKPLAALFSKSIVADGRLTLEVNGNGTVSQPNLRGRVDARQLALEQVENGVLLHDGEAHATFNENELDIAQLSIGAGNGRFNGKGRIASSEGKLTAHLDWTAEHVAAIQRPDLALTLSGDGALDYDQQHVSLKGRLHVDRGRVELHSGNAPELGDDVVVAGRKSDTAGKAKLLKAAVDLSLDLGPDFLVTGNGLDARLEGKLHVTSPGEAPLTARGEISLARGTYQAYGRKLEIEKGTLYFTGPLDNPGLNIRAMRKNQQVEAGVEITGTARAPVVKLVSNPEVPDNEKLAWLVLGHKPDAANHTDTQALQQSAALLLANVGTSPLQKQIGLDELSFSSGDTGSTGGVVTLGKRISERIYVMVERGLTTASNAVKVNYQLSRRWSLRTESGRTDAVDIFYSFSWD